MKSRFNFYVRSSDVICGISGLFIDERSAYRGTFLVKIRGEIVMLKEEDGITIALFSTALSAVFLIYLLTSGTLIIRPYS